MNAVASTNLWFPGQQDPFGWPIGIHHDGLTAGYDYDRLRYVVWVDAGRWRAAQSRPELAPRTALHLVDCRNGAKEVAHRPALS